MQDERPEWILIQDEAFKKARKETLGLSQDSRICNSCLLALHFYCSPKKCDCCSERYRRNHEDS